MKLTRTQIVGLVAIVVFGGGMIFRLTQPSEREIMEKRLASLPRIDIPAPEFPPLDLPAIPSVTPPTIALDSTAPSGSYTPPAEKDYLAIGSQAAKDDFYCSGVLGAEFDVKIKTDHPDKVAPLLDMQKKLDSAGVEKLKAEKVSDGEDWAYFTSAYRDRTNADYAGKTLRIPVEACVARATPLPPGTLY
ncbi:MAG: hypothetical protein QM773_03555 [Hyphomonadaceae bacterium]